MTRSVQGMGSEAGDPEDRVAVQSQPVLSVEEARLRMIIREELRALLRVEKEDHGGLLTARETAALLRVDERTLRRLVVEGSVPAPLRIGRRAIRWDRDSLRRGLGLGSAG